MNSKFLAIMSIVLIATLNIANASAISKPDLVASSFDVSITNSSKSGSLVICNAKVNATVKNEGNLTSTLTLVIIRDLTTNTVIYTKDVGQLDPNTEKSISFNVGLKGEGVHKLIFEVNPVVNADTNFRLIDEFDTSNNSIEKDVLCQYQLFVPDLTITDLEVSIITEPEGDKLQVNYTVKNIGNLTSNSGSVSLYIKDIGYIGGSGIGSLLPNEEKEFTFIRDITGELSVSQDDHKVIGHKEGIKLQIGKEYKITAKVTYVNPSEINTSNNAMSREFTYTTLPREGLFITPLAWRGDPKISIQLCAEEPLHILSAAIIDRIGNTYYNLEQVALDIGECHVWYSQDFKDLNGNKISTTMGLYTIIVDTDKGPIYGEYVGESFFVTSESFIGAAGIMGAAIGAFIVYNMRKRTSI